jgi:regulator of sigma E protease
MDTILIKALQLILSLSILVIVHEFGHFLFAKLFHVRVEKFYLFFNPWFSLLKFKPKRSDTEYGIGWLPLGGYVKISGMIDESMDREAMKQPPQPWEFRVKPAGQRLLIMVGGVLMNFILAFFIYSMVVFKWGDNYVPIDRTPLFFSETALQAGFQDGDIILEADGKNLKRYDDLSLFKIIDASRVTVLRDDRKEVIEMPGDFKSRFLAAKTIFADFTPARIDSLVPGSNAEKAGLKTGDQIVSINEKAVNSLNGLVLQLEKYKNVPVELGVVRNQEKLNLTAMVDSEGKIGFSTERPMYVQEKHNFFESIPAGISFGMRKLSFYVLQLKIVFTKAGLENLGGFGSIGSLFPAKWNWNAFWSMTAFLSIMLGVMNLLPIPALDGGHVLFLLYEVVTRRQPNEKLMEYAQGIGMVLLFALLIYANGMDIFRAFFK